MEHLYDEVLIVGERTLGAALCAACDGRMSDASPAELATARAVVLVGMSDPFTRIQAWRMAGHRVGVVAWMPSVPDPDDRALLEPLVVVRPPATPMDLPAALERLRGARPRERLQLERGQVDFAKGLFVPHRGKPVRLSGQETALLAYLAARPGREIDREELRIEVWGHASAAGSTRAVDMAISRLRKKLESNPRSPRHVLTRRGGGYRLVLDTPRSQGPALPAPPRLHGRDSDLEALADQISRERLVTVLGPPGAGKTSLALGLASTISDSTTVHFCDLVPATDRSGLLLQLAVALGIDSGVGQSDDAVSTHLGRAMASRGPMLVILDNAEHVVGAVAEAVRTWLDEAPETTFLVTSQVRLALMRERVYSLAPLERGPSTEMLVERCRVLATEVSSDDPHVQAIVDLSDGLPLALDLAAARVRILGAAGVHHALRQSLGVLRDRRRDRVQRHVSLERALDLAWQRLTQPQQEILARLSCFRGSFDWSAALAIAPEGASEDAFSDDLEGLIDQSLVRSSSGALRLLAPIRTHARMRAEAGTLSQALARHAAWVATTSVSLARQTRREHGIEALARLAELDGDIEDALNWAMAHHDVPCVSDLTHARYQLLALRGNLASRVALVDRSLAFLDAHGGTWFQADLLRWRASALAEEGRHDEARVAIQRAVHTAEEVGRDRQLCDALMALSDLYRQVGDLQAALEAVRRAGTVDAPDDLLDLVRAKTIFVGHFVHDDQAVGPNPVAELRRARDRQLHAGELWAACQIQIWLVTVAQNRIGDQDLCRRERALLLSLHERSPLTRRAGVIRALLGLDHLRDEYPEEALVELEEAIRTLTSEGQHLRALMVSHTRAMTLLHLRRWDTALTDLHAQRARMVELGLKRHEAHILEAIGLAHLDRGEVDRAAEALRQGLGLATESQDAIMCADLRIYLAMVSLIRGEAEHATAFMDAVELGNLPDDHRLVGLGVKACTMLARSDDPVPWIAQIDALLHQPRGVAYATSMEVWREAWRGPAETLETLARTLPALPARLLARVGWATVG